RRRVGGSRPQRIVPAPADRHGECSVAFRERWVSMMTTVMSEHEERVDQYYRRATSEFYVPHWNDDHIHFGLFVPGEAVELDPSLDASIKEVVRVPVERMMDAVIGPAGITAGDRVVDAGCGIGGTALHVAERHGCEVIGVNICADQLE